MYVDSSDLNSPVAMEMDVPLIEDVQRLKKTVEAGATQVNLNFSVYFFVLIIPPILVGLFATKACNHYTLFRMYYNYTLAI